MGPCEHPSTPSENQDSRPHKTGGCKRQIRRPRSRVCLLKGCHCVYRPQHPLTRYCGEACREQARRWQDGRLQGEAAGAKPPLPRTPEGKKSKNPACWPREGHPYQSFFLCSCDRPGCYALFRRTRRSPLQRFCSLACRHALERVLERERRWRERYLDLVETSARTREKCPMKTCRYRPDILRPWWPPR